MKGIICYYSSTGNTKLACQYIAKHITSVTFDLFNIATDNDLNLAAYEIIGFASSTDFMAPPFLLKQFIDKLPVQNGKLAFVFNTYGLVSGKTLTVLKNWVSAKGFKVIAGHSLQTPENYPPLIVKGIKSEQAPKLKQLNKFKDFIGELNNLLASSQSEELEEVNLKIGIINSLSPTHPRTKARIDMGSKYIEDSLCIECGICKSTCPYGAVELNPKPVFNMEKCYGCWSCFHHCPNKAIYTKKIRGKGHYPEPVEQLKKKLKL